MNRFCACTLGLFPSHHKTINLVTDLLVLSNFLFLQNSGLAMECTLGHIQDSLNLIFYYFQNSEANF